MRIAGVAGGMGGFQRSVRDDATQRRRLRNAVEQSRQLQSEPSSCRSRADEVSDALRQRVRGGCQIDAAWPVTQLLEFSRWMLYLGAMANEFVRVAPPESLAEDA